MAKKDTKPQTEVDADGLVVQKYRSLVLVVVPPADYGEQALRYARSSLYNVHVGTRSVSTQMSDLRSTSQESRRTNATDPRGRSPASTAGRARTGSSGRRSDR